MTVAARGFGIGQPVRRVEDRRFITGRGRYVEDLYLPHQAYGHCVLSPHAHAHISKIDTGRARASLGVISVLTGADLEAAGIGHIPPNFMPEDQGGPKGYRAMRRVLVTDRVRHVGDRVAFVVAETAVQARDAAELLDVAYEPLQAVTGSEQAATPGAPLVWEEAPGNQCVALQMGNKAATEAAFAQAAQTVKLKIHNNRLVVASMEPRGAVGDYNAADESFTLYTATQNPHGIRTMLAQRVLKVPESRLRVIANDVGGGFGMKGDTYPDEVLVLLASRHCGRPVKWVATRSDSFLTDDFGRDQDIEAELALDADGRILGLRSTALHNFGAYVVGSACVPLIFGMKLMPGVYDIPAVHVTGRAIFTNTTPTGPYRGAGRPEAAYIIERLLDLAAEKTGIDPVELRRRNYIPPSKFPHKTATGNVFDSGNFLQTMEQTIALADWDGYPERFKQSQAAGKLRGRALIYYIEDAGIFNERMEVRFDPGGTVTIIAGTFSHGQSHATTYAQCVSDWLGVPFETIRFVQGDTDKVMIGRGTYASRSAVVGGSALKLASEAVIEKGKAFASFMLEASAGDLSFKDGRYQVVGTDRTVSLIDVAKTAYRPAGLPRELGVGLEGAGTFDGDPPSFPNGCHVCEVEIDPETGITRLERYVVVDDAGTIINPLVVHGQVQGGLAQGIGQALMEQVAYDDGGQLISGSFTDYAMPRAEDMADFVLDFNEVPCRTNPLGVKGAGEAGTVGAPPAIINAILDALRPLGVRHIDMPATPRRVWEALAAARAG